MAVENKFVGMPQFRKLNTKYQEWVYFVEAATSPILIKIGKSFDLNKRLTTLQGMSPVQLRLIGAVIAPSGAEFVFHALFAKSRAHGEWFYPSADLLQVIKGLPKAGEIDIGRLTGFGHSLGVPDDYVRKVLKNAKKRTTPGLSKGIAAYYDRYYPGPSADI